MACPVVNGFVIRCCGCIRYSIGLGCLCERGCLFLNLRDDRPEKSGFLLLFDLFLLLIHPSVFFHGVVAGVSHVADRFAPFSGFVEQIFSCVEPVHIDFLSKQKCLPDKRFGKAWDTKRPLGWRGHEKWAQARPDSFFIARFSSSVS